MGIKRLDPNARFKLICEFDDALIAENKEELAALDIGLKDKDGDPIVAPTRYQQYLADLDESKLKFRDGGKPNYFHIRCLTNQEMAVLQEKYLDWDVKAKKQLWKASKTLYLLEIFNLGVQGLEADGQVAPVTADQIGIGVAVSIGSSINLYTQFGKNLKK